MPAVGDIPTRLRLISFVSPIEQPDLLLLLSSLHILFLSLPFSLHYQIGVSIILSFFLAWDGTRDQFSISSGPINLACRHLLLSDDRSHFSLDRELDLEVEHSGGILNFQSTWPYFIHSLLYM